jgi:23S rRNA pseudouridine2605 synthase
MRINKFIAAHSPNSRRKADELIAEGRVKLNGKILKDLGTTIDPDSDQVSVNNIPLKPQATKQSYVALHKPSGCVSTRNDEFNRKTILDLLPKNLNLKPVGRLDKDTEGLIFLSNDGDFINRLTHPKFECQKEYYGEIKGILSYEDRNLLEKGVLIEGKKTAPAKIKIIKKEAAKEKTIVTIVIHEGRKRQIRKMFASINHPVKYLRRIRIGPVKLGNLAKGQYRFLTKSEINAF